ncbi:hypothetical protein KIL84_015265 [Mauremys mutica]|uniref:Uncharacterized protein n=1 Tax=Mauremys mutica TaxID=74926 RepID=A0A9D4APN7_9SAUR|nr:hypothetical protein KIL84_015265 [Mauremys mutica]
MMQSSQSPDRHRARSPSPHHRSLALASLRTCMAPGAWRSISPATRGRHCSIIPSQDWHRTYGTGLCHEIAALIHDTSPLPPLRSTEHQHRRLRHCHRHRPRDPQSLMQTHTIQGAVSIGLAGGHFFHHNSLSPRSLVYESEFSTIQPALDMYDENKT